MPRCELDYRHTPMWCDACWDNTQQARQANSLRDISERLSDIIKLGLVELGDTTVTAPPRPSPTPPPPPDRTPRAPKIEWTT
jgi:hypothetical protein